MNFFASYVSPLAHKYVKEVLASTMLSEGWWVREFESHLEEKFKLPNKSVVCVNSGTSALHLALRVLGIGAGDEVIIPPLTFIATGLAVLYCGAKPIFADITTLGTISAADIEKKITKKTKAIIAVNWAGYPCQLEEIQKIAKLHGVKLVVDAAQSIGYGMGGDITCLSFQATKHVTSGDGGALICYNKKDYQKARDLSWFGINKETAIPDELGERVYNLDDIGYKYHMTNIDAVIGIANLETLENRMAHRYRLAEIYILGLKSVTPIHSMGALWAMPVLTNDVKKFSRFCKKNKIPTSIIHRGIDNNSIFGGKDRSLWGMRRWEESVTHLPIHHEIRLQDAMEVCEKVNKY